MSFRLPVKQLNIEDTVNKFEISAEMASNRLPVTIKLTIISEVNAHFSVIVYQLMEFRLS